MNGGFQNNRDEIGIDPTTVEIIDTLDLEGNNNQNGQEPRKKRGKFKEILIKILFTFGILLFMGIVAFGVYFYLNLGKKKAEANKPKFVLEDKTVYVGSVLSESILDYGNFATVDISGCLLDTTNVNTSKPGIYEYSMTCDGSKFVGKINVITKYDYEVNANVLYKTSSDVLIASEFIEGSSDYTYIIKDNDVTNLLYTPGGPYYVEINLSDNKENKLGIVSSVFYVTEAKARSFLTCTSDLKESDDINALKYHIVDTFAFDSLKNNLNVPSRIYVYEDLTTEQYVELLNKIENGKLTIDNVSGYALRQDTDSKIKIAVDFKNEDFISEVGELNSYDEIKKYYEERNYTCE